VSKKTEELKREAALYAVRFLQPGMVIGLGGGTTAAFAVRQIALMLREQQLTDILGIPCSIHVEAEARSLGIPLTTLADHPAIDVTIDGADEVDPHLNLIKGGGGALLREKIVAQATRREIIVVDESKLSPALGTHWPLPVEVIPFGWPAQISFLEDLGGRPVVRKSADGTPFQTDEGNLILDSDFGPISEPEALAARLGQRAGVVEHGLFLGLASEVVVAGDKGIRHLRRGETA
jgi:ribose 5-phosphate isomerase A